MRGVGAWPSPCKIKLVIDDRVERCVSNRLFGYCLHTDGIG